MFYFIGSINSFDDKTENMCMYATSDMNNKEKL